MTDRDSKPDSSVQPNTVVIRLAEAHDLDAVARVHVRAWQYAFRAQIPDHVLDGLDAGKWAERWRELFGNPRLTLWVAVAAGEVIGFSTLLTPEPPASHPHELGALYVDPSHWRSGFGSALIRRAIDAAHGGGATQMTLWVLDTNITARRFYERAGFRCSGETRVVERSEYSRAEVRYLRHLGA